MKNEIGLSVRYPKADLGNPAQFRHVVQNIVNVHNATPQQVRDAGRHWYDRVNEAVTKGVRGTSLSHWQGSGLVAAVSPNMDFEANNIDAFHELTKLKRSDWATIQASATGANKTRTGEAASVLQGMSVAKAPDAQLVKAHRILQGEDPNDVLNRRTAPKTNSFAHNIEHPGTETHVTIDGRAHDIGMNRMTPWTFSGRGISSAQLARGGTSRYEHFENAYRSAAGALQDEGHFYHPHQLQAVTWEGGKVLEKAAPTKSGRPRVKGVTRVGQPYV